MRLFLAPIALVTLAIGRNTVSPDQCYPNTTGGFGGSGAIPIGAGVGVTSGGLGDGPQSGPLDYTDPPNPCIEPATPCLGKCLDIYVVAAGECGLIPNAAERRTCQDGAYSAYRSCANICHQAEVADCLELCREQCDKANVLCFKNCPKGDKACMKACNDENGRCLKACSNRCK